MLAPPHNNIDSRRRRCAVSVLRDRPSRVPALIFFREAMTAMTATLRWIREAVLGRGRDGALLLLLAAAAWIVVFGRIGYPSLLDPDEAHYAQLTREMIRARSWFVPLLDGSP